MAQATLVETQIRDGRRLIERLAAKGMDVTAACWAHESDSDLWFLYLATQLVAQDGATRAAYRRVGPVIQELRKDGIWIDPLEVKVIGPDDPIARAVMTVREQHGVREPTWYRGNRLGPLAVEAVCIYPDLIKSPQICSFEYQRRGQTDHWDATVWHLLRCDPENRWIDQEARFEQRGDKVTISVYSEDALLEDDATIAEELADAEFERRFPGHIIHRIPDEN